MYLIFLQLDIILPTAYKNKTTWLISAPNINLTKFGMILDGSIWTPARTEVFHPWKRMINTVLCVVYLVLYALYFV